MAVLLQSLRRSRGSTQILIKSCLIGGLALAGPPSPAHGALCILRNPDRQIFELFPTATGYRSRIVNVNRNPEGMARLVEFLGQKLDFDERGEHTFYEVLDGKQVIGIVRPHSERGRYGAVEVVWAFALEGAILDYRIQRSRERGTAAIVTERFREQFTGKTMTDPFTVGSSKDINHGAFGFVPDGAESVASAIAYSAKKNLAIMKYLLLEY